MTDVELANTTWWASFWGSIENWAFLAVVVALAVEFAALKFGAPYKEKLEADKDLKIAELNQETVRLRHASFMNAEANLANARAARAASLAAQAMQATAEVSAVAQGIPREKVGEAARIMFISAKVTPFPGKQFDITSSDIVLETLLGSLRQVLKTAGWIEIPRSDAGTVSYHDGQSTIGGAALVKVQVAATKIGELWEAAEALALAIKDEGIEALAEPTSIPDNSNANIIHILIGPKVQ